MFTHILLSLSAHARNVKKKKKSPNITLLAIEISKESLTEQLILFNTIIYSAFLES
jgi:hypothetical protein